MNKTISAENESALHELIEEAFRLAAQIRVVSGGQMTLAAVRNTHVSPAVKERAGFIGGVEWTGAHHFAAQLARQGWEE